MEKDRIAHLVGRYFDGACSVEEEEELAGWISQAGDDETLRSVLEEAWRQYEPGEDIRLMAGPFLDRLQEHLFEKDEEAAVNPVPVLWYRRIWKVAAAAAVIFLIAGIFIWQNRRSRQEAQIAQVQDARPGGDKAMLTLSDGSRIVLDSAANGKLAVQGSVAVEKQTDGRIKYQPSAGAGSSAIVYNILSTPRGGRYQLTLPDGTKVWLNSASSITYPVAFTGSQRKVTVTGETYFEVQQDPQHPFVVSKGGVDIAVLGTSFNVNAYDEEQDLRVTLLQGSVKASRAGSSVLLEPGQQAEIAETIHVNSQVNLGAVVAWKNGSFNFDGKPLPVILRQLSRWYDVNIVYNGTPHQVKIGGEMGMDLNLSQVLKVLHKMGVNARLEEKNLIIMP
jgi:transmembrane sensor